MSIIVKHPRARIDLAEIWEYIAEDNVEQADAFIETIDQRFHALAEQPNMGRLRDELAEGVRSFSIGRYIVFYLPLSKGVEIVRVLHGARDLNALFHEED